MAKKAAKPIELGRTYCAACGQPICSSVTKVGALLQATAKKKGLSGAAVGRLAGVSNQTISMLYAGHQGNRSIYRGQRARRRGETPLDVRVAKILGVKDSDLAAARLADEMMMIRMPPNACFAKHAVRQHESTPTLLLRSGKRAHAAA